MQTVLDAVGFIPGLGEPADGLNAIISLLRGNYVDAGLSALSILPLADLFTKAGKYIGKGANAVEAALDYGDEAVDAIGAAAKNADEAVEAGQTVSILFDGISFVISIQVQKLCRRLYEGSILMESRDLTSDVIDGFNWLESELGYIREVSQHKTFYFAKTIEYKKGNITIRFDCDNRESMLFFEIFVVLKNKKIAIQEPKILGDFYKSDYVDEGYQNIEYDSIFNYTKDAFDKQQFQRLKNEAELQLKKRGGRKKYVEVFSQMIKAAITSIEGSLK